MTLLAVVGCSAGGASPSGDRSAEIGEAEATASAAPVQDGAHRSPVIFAFRCDDGDHTDTYTTYDAVWAADRSSCTAERLTGSVPSGQQRRAVATAGGTATLRDLAARCAVSEGSPWDGEVTSSRQARIAEALAVYCPGHPRMDDLREALEAYRG